MLEFLNAHFKLDHLRAVGGTSSGAIVACLLAFGATPAEMKEFFDSMDYNKLMDVINPNIEVGLK